MCCCCALIPRHDSVAQGLQMLPVQHTRDCQAHELVIDAELSSNHPDQASPQYLSGVRLQLWVCYLLLLEGLAPWFHPLLLMCLLLMLQMRVLKIWLHSHGEVEAAPALLQVAALHVMTA